MLSKSSEIELYSTMYHLAFEKDKSFFHKGECAVIYSFLCENYWGENLTLRIKLLVNLLRCDAGVHSSKIKKELMKKSEELNKYLNQNLKQDRST